MKICVKCNAQLDDAVLVCPNCGVNFAADAQQPVQPQPQYQQPVQPQYQQPYQAAPAVQYPPLVTLPTGELAGDPSDVQANKTMGILAYILFFIPLLNGSYKNSPFVKYHTNQGTILWIFWVAVWVASAILRTIIWNILSLEAQVKYAWGGGGFYGIVSILLWIVTIAVYALCIVGILNVNNGKCKPLPVIGKLFTIIK